LDIIVCIKQVPDTAEITIDRDTGNLNRESVGTILNPFDVYAIEEALVITEKLGGNTSVLSMGPMRAKDIIVEAFSMGVNRGFLLNDRDLSGSDTFCTARVLSKAIKKIKKYDLIVCGKQAIDGDTGQVGPAIAEMLNIPHVSYVKKVKKINKDVIIVERLVENKIEVIEMKLPGLITVLKDINSPRLPSFKLRMAAKKKKITLWRIKDLTLTENEVGLRGSLTSVDKTFIPELKNNIEKLSGSIDEIADKLIKKIYLIQNQTK